MEKKREAEYIKRINERLLLRNQSVAEAIAQRELYFRISITGLCNLNCPFCHNEGGPFSDFLHPSSLTPVFPIIKNIGFTRIQFTGGEPLINKKIVEFIVLAKEYFEDVGITTNGTLLESYLDKLVASNISKIHISLQ